MNNNKKTKIPIPTTKNIIWLWKLIIPSIIGVAGAWNPICQLVGASNKVLIKLFWKKKFKINNNKNFLIFEIIRGIYAFNLIKNNLFIFISINEG